MSSPEASAEHLIAGAVPATLGVGLVGAGAIGGAHAAAFEVTPGCRPLRLASRRSLSGGRQAAFAAWRCVHADWREVTRAPDVDLVVIAVPDELHYAVGKDALIQGKHVLCEKPLTADVAQARELADLAANAPGASGVALILRQWPALRDAAALIASGQLGPARRIRAWSRQSHFWGRPVSGWRGAGQLGALQDLGPHVIDAAAFLGAGEFAAEGAWTVRSRAGAVDSAIGVGRVRDALTTVEVGWAEPGHTWDVGFEVACDDGAVAGHWSRADSIRVLRGRQQHYERQPLSQQLVVAEMFARQACAMVAACRGQPSELPSFCTGAALVEAVDQLAGLMR